MTSIRRALSLGAIVTLALVAGVRGQTAQAQPPGRTQMDELLAEVRAIRSDLDRAAAASMRGQLLGMRLQLQEQRINTLARQLSDVRQRLRDNAQARESLIGPVKMFAQQTNVVPPVPEKPGEPDIMGMFKQQLVLLDKADAELKVEESQVLGQLQDEQSRWSSLNAQIEEMERSATSKAVR